MSGWMELPGGSDITLRRATAAQGINVKCIVFC
jgi:hypothetical protein